MQTGEIQIQMNSLGDCKNDFKNCWFLFQMEYDAEQEKVLEPEDEDGD